MYFRKIFLYVCILTNGILSLFSCQEKIKNKTKQELKKEYELWWWEKLQIKAKKISNVEFLNNKGNLEFSNSKNKTKPTIIVINHCLNLIYSYVISLHHFLFVVFLHCACAFFRSRSIYILIQIRCTYISSDFSHFFLCWPLIVWR